MSHDQQVRAVREFHEEHGAEPGLALHVFIERGSLSPANLNDVYRELECEGVVEKSGRMECYEDQDGHTYCFSYRRLVASTRTMTRALP